jgi:hypothetical protein
LHKSFLAKIIKEEVAIEEESKRAYSLVGQL